MQTEFAISREFYADKYHVSANFMSIVNGYKSHGSLLNSRPLSKVLIQGKGVYVA